MANFKKTNYKFWHSPIALVVLFVIVLFSGYKIIDLIKKDAETAHNKDLVLDQISSLRERETSLNSDISKLGTDEGKEEIIRDKYQVAKQGEEMVTIVDNNDDNNSQPQTGAVSHGFWAFIKKLFKF